MLPRPVFEMRNLARMFVLTTFLISPLTLFAQRLSITPPAVTIMEGDSGEFMVVLSSEPTADVTVTILKSNGTEILLDRAELTFTPLNWNVGQTVRLTAVEDEDNTDDDGALILIALGGGYGGDGVIVRPKTATTEEAATIDSVGKSIQLSATIPDQDGVSVPGVSFDWSSADSSVAVVDSTGRVTAVEFGETTITAALAAVQGTTTISGSITVRVASGIGQDRAALVALFNSTDGPNWVNKTNWLTDAPLGDWYGVDTDADGRVIRLNLRGNWDNEHGLTGPIPPELGYIGQLQHLDLAYNSLTGPIPLELGTLVKLTYMNLFQNELTGSIPPELGNLVKLGTLWLAGNSLTGPIPPELGNLARVWQMSLAGNALVGAVPPELGRLTSLNTFYLGGNKLSGTIPLSFQQLSELDYFGFQSNSGLCLPDVLVEWYENMRERNGPICPDREVLQALYNTAGGDGWTNATGWLSEDTLGEWYGVDVDSSGRVSTVDLTGNGLSGGLPSRLGELAGLTTLRIGDTAYRRQCSDRSLAKFARTDTASGVALCEHGPVRPSELILPDVARRNTVPRGYRN